MPTYKISTGADYTVAPNAKGSGAANNHGSATRAGSASTTMGSVSVSRSQIDVFGSTVVDGAYTDPSLNGTTIAYKNQRPTGMRVSSTLAGQSNTVLRSGADVPGQVRSIAKRESFKVNKIATATRNGYWDAYSGKYSAYGTYSRTGSTVTVTVPHHGLATNDYVTLDFTSGAATDGRFQITFVDANTFTLTHGSSGSTSGNVTVKGPGFAVETPYYNNSASSDSAATPTLASPGQLTYKGGALNPVTTNDYKAKTTG